ncbi:MAG: chorismate mutase [Nanobdellota archaeon]
MDQIKPLKEELEKIDENIIKLLEKRLEKTGQIWQIRKKMYIPLRDSKQESAKIESLVEKTRLDPIIIRTLYQNLFSECDRIYG